MKILLLLLATGGLGTAGPVEGSAEPAPYFGVSPLGLEGVLWAPPLEHFNSNEVSFKFGYIHNMVYAFFDDFIINHGYLMLSGQYALLNRITLGVDVPLHSIGSQTELGSVRLHARYPIQLHETRDKYDAGVIITPAIRSCLPTRTMGLTRHGEESLVQIEPMLLVGLYLYPFSMTIDGNLKFLAIDDHYDHILGAANLVFGFGPFPRPRGFEIVAEVNILSELTGNCAVGSYLAPEYYLEMPLEEGEQPIRPTRCLAVAMGLRYKGDNFVLEFAYRAGGAKCSMTMGLNSWGLKVAYRFD